MSVVGLTGSPGAGKTTIANIFKELGAEIVSADEIGREVVESNSEVLEALIKAFGKDILDERGNLNRRQLSGIVFSSDDALKKLNRIVHPSLLMELKRIIDEHRFAKGEKLMIVDAALIYEWGIADWFDAVIVVYADLWLRIKRLKSLGLTESEVMGRTDSQLPQEEKIRRSDYTIENNGLLKDIRPEVEKLYRILMRPK